MARKRRAMMTPEEAEIRREEAESLGKDFSGWRLGSVPEYESKRVGKNAVQYLGQTFLKNIERRTLESRVEAVVLLKGTTFELSIHPALEASAETWEASLGRPRDYPKGRGGRIAKPEDPFLMMDPGIELYFRGGEIPEGKAAKFAKAKYLNFNTLSESINEKRNKKGIVTQVNRILREPDLEEFSLTNLRKAAFRKERHIKNYNQKKNSFFSRTSKMGSASFSVMAGAPGVGGTCPATNLWKSPKKLMEQNRQIVEEGGEVSQGTPDTATWICNYCYAGKSNYIYRNVQWTEVGRWIWLQGMVRDSYKDALKTMKWMLKCHLSNVGMREKAGEDPQFFRIHDSGDFNPISTGISTYDLWHDIISDRAFRKIHFWAPTRMWASERFRELVARKPPPKNFSLRPSALHIDDISPDIAPFGAGSTVHSKGKKNPKTYTKKVRKKNEVWSHETGEKMADWECPAYMNKNACIGAGGPNGEKNCRVCWGGKYSDWSVSYKAH